MITFDTSVNLGHLIQVGVIAVGGLGVIWAMRGDLKALGGRMTDVEASLLKVEQILITTARQDEKIIQQDKRIGRLEDELSDLRRGRGFIRQDA